MSAPALTDTDDYESEAEKSEEEVKKKPKKSKSKPAELSRPRTTKRQRQVKVPTKYLDDSNIVEDSYLQSLAKHDQRVREQEEKAKEQEQEDKPKTPPKKRNLQRKYPDGSEVDPSSAVCAKLPNLPTFTELSTGHRPLTSAENALAKKLEVSIQDLPLKREDNLIRLDFRVRAIPSGSRHWSIALISSLVAFSKSSSCITCIARAWLFCRVLPSLSVVSASRAAVRVSKR